MKEFIATVLTLGLIAAIIAFVITLIRPKLTLNTKLFKTNSRKKLAVYYSGILIALFILIAIFAPTPTQNEQLNSTTENTNSSEQTNQTASEQPEAEKLKRGFGRPLRVMEIQKNQLSKKPQSLSPQLIHSQHQASQITAIQTIRPAFQMFHMT